MGKKGVLGHGLLVVLTCCSGESEGAGVSSERESELEIWR